MNGTSIRLRAGADPKGMASVRLLVSHPMLPQHHIENIIIAINGETALQIACSRGMAADPYFAFSVAGVKRGDAISVSWTDNRNQSDVLHAYIE